MDSFILSLCSGVMVALATLTDQHDRPIYFAFCCCWATYCALASIQASIKESAHAQ